MSSLSQAQRHLASKGYPIGNSMAPYIEEWLGWYMGANKFYNYKERVDSRTFKFERKTLHPARFVCTSWASLLFNESTEIISEDASANEWLDNYLKMTSFLAKGQGLVESGFALGTSAWSLRFENIAETGLKSPSAKVFVQRHEAREIIPLTYNEDELQEVAFVSNVVVKGEKLVQLAIHELIDTGYRITILFFSDKGQVITGNEAVIETKSFIPLFGLIRPAIDNIYDPITPMGRSIFDDAIDCIQMVDMAWDNMHKDIYLGQAMLFISDTLLGLDANGNAVIPREKDQQIFRKVIGGAGDAVKASIEHFQPSLRIEENKEAISEAMDKLSLRCGFGKGYLNQAKMNKTATEVVADNMDLFNNLKTHQNELHKPLHALGKALLWSANEVMNVPVDYNAPVEVRYADSVVDDSNTKRAQDLSDIGAGIMQVWEYRVKWYGEDEATAKANAPSGIDSLL